MSFSPLVLTITNITKANPAVVTTSNNHNMKTGQVIRLLVSKTHGMTEINNSLAQITSLSSVTFSLNIPQPPFTNIDSRNFTTFINTTANTPAQAIPIGQAPTPVLSPASAVTNNVYDSPLDDQTFNYSTTPIPF